MLRSLFFLSKFHLDHIHERYSSFMMYSWRLPRADFFRPYLHGTFDARSRSGIFAALAVSISLTFLIATIVQGYQDTSADTLPGIPKTGEVLRVTDRVVATTSAPVAVRSHPMREVHVANNGAVYLRGARITAISSSSITVSSGWGSMDFSWDVVTGIGTRYINAKGEAIKRSSLKVGTIVAVTGVLDESAHSASMRGQYIRVSKSN